MNIGRLKKYETQLVQLEARLSGDLQELVREIDDNRLRMHDHEADTSEEINTEIALSENESVELSEVRAALNRLKSGTYGTCQTCGCTIPAARLNVIPYTAFCIDCEAKREAGR